MNLTPLFDLNVVRKIYFISDLQKILIKKNKDIKNWVVHCIVFRTELDFIKYSQQSVGLCFMIFCWLKKNYSLI